VSQDPPRHMENSVFVGRDAGVIQHVSGRGKATLHQAPPSAEQREIHDLISQLRDLLDESRSRLAPEAATEYGDALDAIETEAAAGPQRNGFSIREALEVLAGAAGVVNGWIQAVTALRHALGL
jgi:hypothetical protein